MVPSDVASGVLGRTNQAFPNVWLSLSAPISSEEIEPLVQAALDSGLPIDITSQPALWGGMMRGSEAFLTCIGDSSFEVATDETHAMDLIHSSLIGLLSAIGRETINIYFLRVRNAAEEFQISGALQALELARQEGHIQFLGLCCDGNGFGSLATWQFHDAFDLILVPRNHYDDDAYQTLSPLAKDRRVGLVTSKPLNWGHGIAFPSVAGPWRLRNLCKSFYGRSIAQAVITQLSQEHPVMVGVKSAAEVAEAVQCLDLEPVQGLAEYLEPFLEAFQSDEEWQGLSQSEIPWLMQAAKRRVKESIRC